MLLVAIVSSHPPHPFAPVVFLLLCRDEDEAADPNDGVVVVVASALLLSPLQPRTIALRQTNKLGEKSG